MVEARHRFLSAGFYHALAELLASMSAVKPEVALLDAGCGEGYYLRQLQELSPHITWQASGLDISKPAIDHAAKHHKGCCWMVASNAKIPLPDESVDVLWCVFGFPQGDEFVRVLKPGGRLIQVDAGSEHLMELREVIYPEVKIKQPPALIDHPSLSAGRRECIQEVMSLDQQNIADLMLMTPHLFKANKVGRDKALSLSRLECRTHMVLRELIKASC
jgi:23S rRNA (guanine745-N1)-methyltransferase